MVGRKGALTFISLFSPQLVNAIITFLGSNSGHSLKQRFPPKAQIARWDPPASSKKEKSFNISM
jgi:hypothetical protein